MNSIVERLIESWLDSQGERQYQPAFIQLLISEGWSVLHNTRHSPIEFGKDVIARNPNGVLYCFQLKGNPGSRVTKSDAQASLPQFFELLQLAPAKPFRNGTDERHVAVFVTNGEMDEEARLLFETAGEATRKRSCSARKFELWTRGTLIARFLDVAGKVWPTSLEGTRQILNLMTRDGREIPNPQEISKVLTSVSPEASKKLSSAAKTAHLSALLLVAEIIKSPWYATKNHYGLYVNSVLACVYALRFADNDKRLSTVNKYANLCLEHCADLLCEAQNLRFDPDLVWAQQDALSEFDVMWERRRLIGDCAATLVISGKIESKVDSQYVEHLVRSTFLSPRLWGLAAVPALIVRYWAMCRIHAGVESELHFAAQLRHILAASLGRIDRVSPLASPYYGFVDCWAHAGKISFLADDSIFTDSFERRVWFARAMLFMLAKRNWKQSCKLLWPSFSQVLHEEPDLPTADFFDSLLKTEGRMLTYSFHRKDWTELVEEAIDDNGGRFLEPFASLAWLIAAYIAIVPYRGWTGVLMWLDSQLNTTWYSRDHPPTE